MGDARANTQSQPLIQPCHISWSVDAMHAALTRLWGYQYEAVAAADLIGDDSNAGAFDEERGGDHRREKIGRGLASAMLLGSFGGQGQRSGFSAKDLKLACSRPEPELELYGRRVFWNSKIAAFIFILPPLAASANDSGSTRNQTLTSSSSSTANRSAERPTTTKFSMLSGARAKRSPVPTQLGAYW